MWYECVKGFDLPLFDIDGYETDESEIIETDSKWFFDFSVNNYGAWIYLQDTTGYWIQISRNDFEEHFNELE